VSQKHPQSILNNVAKGGLVSIILKLFLVLCTVADLGFSQGIYPIEKKLLGEPPSPLGYGLVRLGHSVARVKISGRSTP